MAAYEQESSRQMSGTRLWERVAEVQLLVLEGWAPSWVLKVV